MMAGVTRVAVLLALLVFAVQLTETGTEVAEDWPQTDDEAGIQQTIEEGEDNGCGKSDQNRPPKPEQETCQVSVCPEKTKPILCPKDDRYRTIDGSCNNREHPQSGKAGTAYKRMFYPEYEDGMCLPRGWTNSSNLPEPRVVSNVIGYFRNKSGILDNKYSQMVVFFGQQITHDMIITLLGESPSNGSSCNNEGNNFPTQVPPNDPTRNATESKCMPFTRAEAACCNGAQFRNQVNGVTAAIDASFVYGSKECQSKSLRNTTSQQGLLKVNEHTDNGRALLPFVNVTEDLCGPEAGGPSGNQCANNVSCFVAGDSRANQHSALMSLQILFLREHNRVAKELSRINPHWCDEMIFQEARKILGAQLQMITYNQYLHNILGDSYKEVIPPYEGYNPEVCHSAALEFTIAWRWAHPTVAPWLYLLNSHFQPEGPNSVLRFHQTFTNSLVILQHGLDAFFRGMLKNSAKKMLPNKVMIEDLRDQLFAQNGLGLDLLTIDIQRGRDLGVPGYLAVRRACCLSEPRNLEELVAVFKDKRVCQKLMKLYGSPENIDLLIGLILEPPVPNGAVGPTVACIVGHHFVNIRNGDRFFYQKKGMFSDKQVQELNKITIATLICHNSGLEKVPRDAFKANENPQDYVDCKTLPKLDLTAWKEDTNLPDDKICRHQ